jgi:hypothetical protein
MTREEKKAKSMNEEGQEIISQAKHATFAFFFFFVLLS